MKNKIIFTLGLLAAVFAACSDGTLPEAPPPVPSESCNVILQAYKVGGDPMAAVTGDIEIASGEGVVLVWNASGKFLTSAVLTSEPAEVVGQPVQLQITEKEVEEEAKVEAPATKALAGKAEGEESAEAKVKIKTAEGTMEYRDLTRDVSFTVIGVNEEEGKAPTECKGSVNVKVTPAPVVVTVNKLDATPSEIHVGESSELCWDVSPSDASVAIVDDKGNALTPPEVAEYPPFTLPANVVVAGKGVQGGIIASGKAQVVDENGEPEPEPQPQPQPSFFPAVGCTTVWPEATTTYTLTATAISGASATKGVNVTVLPIELKINSFLANGQENLILTEAGDVKLTWDVSPAEAVVTIDQDIGKVEAVGSKTVAVSKSTVFTLSASLGEQMAGGQVTVSIQSVGGGPAILNLNAKLTANTTDIFAGEEVTLSWSITNEAGGEVPDVKVLLYGPDGREEVNGGSVTVKPKTGGNYVIEVLAAGGSIRSNQVDITVRSWSKKEGSTSWSSMVVLEDVATFGSAQNSPVALTIGSLTGGSVWTVSTANLANEFEASYTSGYMKGYLNYYGPFAINAIANDPNKGKRLYIGTTGGVMYADSEAGPWALLDRFAIWKGPREHNTCRGEVQKNEVSGIKTTLENLQRVCDLLVVDSPAGGDRLIAATDHGVYYLDGVDKRLADKNSTSWKGFPSSDSTNALTSVIVDALEGSGTEVYAGAANGVWMSSDGGASWAGFNGGDLGEGAAIYALAIDVENKKIYAGGPGGAYVSDLGSASWKKLSGPSEGGVIYSLAVDPAQSGTVYAGGDGGVFVSRDGGEKWSNITESMGGAPVVNSLAVSKSGSTVGIYAATSEGVFSSVAVVASRAAAKGEPHAPAPEATDVMKAIIVR